MSSEAASAAINAARPQSSVKRAPQATIKARVAAITAPTQTTDIPQAPASSAAAPKAKAQPAGKKRGNPSSVLAHRTKFPRPAVFSEDQERAVLLQLRTMSARPHVLAGLEPETLGAVRSMIAGAQIVGPAGHGDRMSLFRLVGLPLAPGTGLGGGSKGDVARAIGQLGDRLVRGLGAREGHRTGGFSRDPVIVDAEVIEESPSNGAFDEVTHKMGDLVCMPPDELAQPDAGKRPARYPRLVHRLGCHGQ